MEHRLWSEVCEGLSRVVRDEDKAGEVNPVKIVRDHECFADNVQTVIDYKSIQVETTV